MKMKATQTMVREYSVVDRDNLITKAEIRFGELTKLEIDEAVQRKDINVLKGLVFTDLRWLFDRNQCNNTK